MRLIRILLKSLGQLLNLTNDQDDQQAIENSVLKGVEFKGVNIWLLIFAIFIASIGLNVNSTAVVIGAMLISPLMGPIIGIGYSIAIFDLDILKKSAFVILISTVVSVLTSTLYFSLTPLREAQSELLARTSPSIWDVFIAFAGGLAGMIASTRKEKGNAIPGTAIATALMPPLCTAGYGIATGNLWYALGALYLYFINSIFIATGAYLISRQLKLISVSHQNSENKKQVTKYIIYIVVITMIPSVYLTYRIVDKEFFKANANKFIREQFTSRINTYIVNKEYIYTTNKKQIDVLLLGDNLSQACIDSIKNQLPKYSLNNVALNVKQGVRAKQAVNMLQIKSAILPELIKFQALSDSLKSINSQNDNESNLDSLLFEEITALFPKINKFGKAQVKLQSRVYNNSQPNTLVLIELNKSPLSTADKNAFESWLKIRLQEQNLEVIYSLK